MGGNPSPQIPNSKLCSNFPEAFRHPLRCQEASDCEANVAGSLPDDNPDYPVILA